MPRPQHSILGGDQDPLLDGLVPVAAGESPPGLLGQLRCGDRACGPPPEQRQHIVRGRCFPGGRQCVLVEVAVLEDRAQQFLVTPAHRLEEDRPRTRRAPSQEKKHHLAMSGTSRPAERGHLVEPIGEVKTGPGVGEAPDDVQMSPVGGEEERSRSVAVRGINRCAAGEQLFDPSQVALPGGAAEGLSLIFLGVRRGCEKQHRRRQED